MFYKNTRNSRKRNKKKLEEQGIKSRWIFQNCHFGLYKIVDNENYYLLTDGKFYTTTYGIRKYEFDLKEEMEEYIKLHMDDFKEKYGDDIQICRFEKRMCIGECKVLEQ